MTISALQHTGPLARQGLQVFLPFRYLHLYNYGFPDNKLQVMKELVSQVS